MAEEQEIVAEVTLTGLALLIKNLQEEIDEETGIELYKDYLAKTAAGYPKLNSEGFKRIKASVSIHKSLPSPPTLGQYAFLLEKTGGKNLRELFETAWTAAT